MLGCSNYEFEYHDHKVSVHVNDVPGGWLADMNSALAICIDGETSAISGAWPAYQLDGMKGVRLVVETYLDQVAIRARDAAMRLARKDNAYPLTAIAAGAIFGGKHRR